MFCHRSFSQTISKLSSFSNQQKNGNVNSDWCQVKLKRSLTRLNFCCVPDISKRYISSHSSDTFRSFEGVPSNGGRSRGPIGRRLWAWTFGRLTFRRQTRRYYYFTSKPTIINDVARLHNILFIDRKLEALTNFIAVP